MRLATITENSVDPQDIELAKLEIPTIKDLVDQISSLPADAPYEQAVPYLKKLKDLTASHWIYDLARLYYLRSSGKNNGDVDRLIKYYEMGWHKRQHGE
tara:strand:- start:1809 stop:2105 length:297 start_codon:yes stop_codon:yes gene_type:complete